MKNLSRGLLAAACALALTPAVASADTVTVRIEGEGVNLARTVDVPTTGTFGPDNCPYDSAAGAIDVATDQNWDRSQFTSTILGESHTYAQRDYWNFWINGSYAQQGICQYALQPGDEVLMLVQRDGPDNRPTVFPLYLSNVPAQAERGQSATVSVAEHVSDGTTTTPRPAEAATVSGAGSTATTGADGRATLTFAQTGRHGVRATKPSRAPSNVQTVEVREPSAAGAPAPTATACETNGGDGRCGTRDRQAPKTLIDSIREKQRFRRGRVARLLRGRAGVAARSDFRSSGLAPDPSGIASIELRLTRNDRGRCSTFDVRRERLVRRRCGAARGTYFKIDEDAQWEYQLPFSLPRGRYVLDVRAVDRAGNKDFERRRRENRVVFFVR